MTAPVQRLTDVLIASQHPIKPVYKVSEVADITGVSPYQVYQWCYAAKLTHTRIGRSVRIPFPALAEFMFSNEREALEGVA